MLLTTIMSSLGKIGGAPGDETSSRIARAGRWIIDERAGAVFCTILFFAVALLVSFDRTFLNDEGIFTYTHARALWREWWAIFFLHKGKPVNVLLEALPAWAGFDVYLLVHVLIGTIAVHLVSATARALGIRHPNIAGWFLATSGIFTVGAAAGYPNTVGAALLALFLFLYYTERRFPAALVLGLLPFSRYELTLVVIIYLAVRLLRHRDVVFLAWAALLPVLYVVAGAAYTGDPLWLPHTMFDPNSMPGDFQNWRQGYSAIDTLRFLGKEFMANSPFLLVLAPLAIGRRSRRALEPVLIAFAFYGIQTFLQVAEIQKFAPQLRHTIAALPLVALAVAAGFSRAGRFADGVVPVARLAWLSVAVVFLGGQLLVGLSDDRGQHERTHELLSELTREGVYRGQRIYSDIYAAEQDRCAGFRETRFLVNPQITWELNTLTSTNPMQRQAVFRAFEEGGWLFEPSQLPLDEDALYIVSLKKRMSGWRKRLEGAGARVRQVNGFAVYQLPSG